MIDKRLIVCAFLLLVLGLIPLQAQESINTSGGDVTGRGGSASYSLGDVNYQFYTSKGGSVSEGIQHAYEIFVVSEIDEARNIKLSVSVYPNPVSSNLQIEVENEQLNDLSFLLFDLQGKLQQSDMLIENQTIIDMEKMASGSYFVKIVQSNREIKIFKVIKN